MLDIRDYTLSPEEQQQLAHPLVGGVILFSRNLENVTQLRALISAIRQITGREFIIAVDHEGGRVQRFKQGFTHIPAMAKILPYANDDVSLASDYAIELGWLMASELLSLDIDISFAPVLDIDICSKVIGDRAFSNDSDQVVALAEHFIMGMSQAGMSCTGKHFPGHGSVEADSHFDIPVDNRSQAAIEQLDFSVFKRLIANNKLDALMPAHVIYPAFDSKPAGFSSFWLQQILRQQLKFDGVLFSDDLAMAGAAVAGNFEQRTKAAIEAGCDMVLVCNKPEAASEILDYLAANYTEITNASQRADTKRRLLAMLGGHGIDHQSLIASERWTDAVKLADAMHNIHREN